MANNSNRKAIEFMVQGALPPHSTNVLWMDTSVPTLPVLKIFENGAWATVHTGDSKAIELLSQTVLAQQNEITELTEDISSKMALDATVAKDSTVAKQQTLTQGIQNISDAIANIDTSDLAKEATLQAVRQEAYAAKVAAQALVPVAAAAEAYNTGKTELAANITAKGVPASASETLPELAEKVSAISQESYTIDGGEIYAKQLSGSLETPNYWNLYEVLTNLLSDGRLVQYGGILLAEYYRGYDSLALAGAGAGGAYVVSDKDENGDFIKYDTDIVHTWNNEFDGKGNRWVAYCFAEEYHDFDITDTETSPRSIFIGRKVGTINCLINTRISKVVVTVGSELNRFVANEKNHNWEANIRMNLQGEVSSALSDIDRVSSIYISGKTLSGVAIPATSILNTVIIDGVTVANAGDREWGLFLKTDKSYDNLTTIILNDIETLGEGGAGLNFTRWTGNVTQAVRLQSLIDLYILNSEKVWFNGNIYNGGATKWKNIHLGYKTNDKTKSFVFGAFWSTTAYYSPIDNIILQDGWCKPLNVALCDSLTEANMYAHILQRLKQDEPNCGSGVTITLGSTNLTKLTSQESQDLLAELRGTYGYTFA